MLTSLVNWKVEEIIHSNFSLLFFRKNHTVLVSTPALPNGTILGEKFELKSNFSNGVEPKVEGQFHFEYKSNPVIDSVSPVGAIGT